MSYKNLIEEADALFQTEKYPEAAEKYGEAKEEAPNDQAKKYCELQISTCLKPAKKNPEVSPEKKKRKNPFKLDIGKEIMNFILKRFLPKIKPAIIKNKPKAIEFMEGKIDMKGQPMQSEAVQRRIIIDLKPSPDGNPDNADVLVQILRADRCRVQIAKDDEGNSIAHEAIYSATEFINMVLDANLNDVAKEIESEAKEKDWFK